MIYKNKGFIPQHFFRINTHIEKVRGSRSARGFTLIELLVVIAIIGVLSSVVLASLNTARERARDATRLQDLREIRTALELYYAKCGTYIVKQSCTGTGYGSNGIATGFFSHPYPSPSAGSVAQGLVDEKVMGGVVVDPSGATTHTATHTGYMIITSANNYTIWANLENPTAAQIATQNSCFFNNYDGYLSTYPVETQTNYCISN